MTHTILLKPCPNRQEHAERRVADDDKKAEIERRCKDTQMTPNDLIALFSELQNGTEKKEQQHPDGSRSQSVLESITQRQQVTDGFAAYFATKNSTREEVAQQSMKKRERKRKLLTSSRIKEKTAAGSEKTTAAECRWK